MEVVLLWLDDLDDLVFATVFVRERLRRWLLRLGLMTALAMAGCELLRAGVSWTPLLASLALACVIGWLSSVLLIMADPRTEAA
jgi:hypothetical protein